MPASFILSSKTPDIFRGNKIDLIFFPSLSLLESVRTIVYDVHCYKICEGFEGGFHFLCISMLFDKRYWPVINTSSIFIVSNIGKVNNRKTKKQKKSTISFRVNRVSFASSSLYVELICLVLRNTVLWLKCNNTLQAITVINKSKIEKVFVFIEKCLKS